MKILALLIALGVVGGPALAQAAECQSIQKASDRLACYDRSAAPVSKVKPAAASEASPPLRSDGSVDPLAAENARLDAKIKNICRGC